MSVSRLCLLLLLAVAIPVQTMAAVSPPLMRFDPVAAHVPGAHMDCHAGPASDVPEAPSCCGDACPDMTVCAAAHAVSATTLASSPIGPLAAPDDHYLLPPVSSRLSYPFRPPAISHV